MAVGVVDPLEAVEIDEQQRRFAFVALQVGERALELAHEAAPVADVEQQVSVGARFELADFAFGDRDLGPQPLDFRNQRRVGIQRAVIRSGRSGDGVRRRHAVRAGRR